MKYLRILHIKFVKHSLFMFWVLCSGTLHTMAQQDSQFTQYMYNTSAINPAYAGSLGSLNIIGLYRTQWIGVDGAPKTINLGAHGPLKDPVGLGVNFIRYEVGPTLDYAISTDLSYTLFLSESLKFNFGVKVGMRWYDIDYSKINLQNVLDLEFQNSISESDLIMGVGGFLHTDKWYLGVSAPSLLNEDRKAKNINSSVNSRIIFYGMGGYVFHLGEETSFKPAFLVKAQNGEPLAIDFSANFRFFNKFTLGAAYRLDAAISGLAGFELGNGLMLGYAYDYDTTDLGSYNSGSHELFLRYNFSSKKYKLKSIRFF